MSVNFTRLYRSLKRLIIGVCKYLLDECMGLWGELYHNNSKYFHHYVVILHNKFKYLDTGMYVKMLYLYIILCMLLLNGGEVTVLLVTFKSIIENCPYYLN